MFFFCCRLEKLETRAIVKRIAPFKSEDKKSRGYTCTICPEPVQFELKVEADMHSVEFHQGAKMVCEVCDYHVAAKNGHYEMVQVLLGQGSDDTTADKEGWTPLHCAAQVNTLRVILGEIHFSFQISLRWLSCLESFKHFRKCVN